MTAPMVRSRPLRGAKAELAARLLADEARSLENELRAAAFRPLDAARSIGALLAFLGLAATLSGLPGMEEAGLAGAALGIVLHSLAQLLNRPLDLHRAFTRELLKRRRETLERLGISPID